MKNIYEINTVVWLAGLSQKYQQPITLANVPDVELDAIINWGIDTIWLMGVWSRSPRDIDIVLGNPQQVQELRDILPDFSPSDIIGSAYAILDYQISPAIGSEVALRAFRQTLISRGIRLILDFVPNHTGLDCPRLLSNPEDYMIANPEFRRNHPNWCFDLGDQTYALGRDPNYEAWTDVAQTNAFSPSYIHTSIANLNYIASLCDGVRADMAMLMLNDIFATTWAELVSDKPDIEYWQAVINGVHANHPDFVFIAESYWDTQNRLIELGFDYCYDKDWLDLIIAGQFDQADSHIARFGDNAKRLVHFLENHDEQRIASQLSGDDLHKAIDALITTNGPKLWFDGQFDGARIRTPVQLGRSPVEPIDQTIQQIYRQTLQS